MRTSGEIGRELEQQVAAYFASHGYRTQCNLVVEGRSGGRHEVDVLAEKADALTSYRVAVECKAWQQPIEKDVVSKLHYVLTDAGLNKGIIVSLGGCRSGAERTAEDLGIDLWGPDEIRRHLGDTAVGTVGTDVAAPVAGSALTTGWGYGVRASGTEAEAAIRATGKGRLGLRTLEELSWFSLIWLPAYCVAIEVAQPETRRLRKVLRASTVNNLYDALTGSFLGTAPAPWEELRFDPKLAPRPSIREAKVHASLRKTFDGYQRVTSAAAIERHAASMREAGLPTPVESMTIASTSLVHLPIYMGVLEGGGQMRAEAVDGRVGRPWSQVSHILTSNLAHLRQSFT